MALIQKIRKNSWILIIFIGLALFAFLLMDMGGGQPNLGDQFTLGKVNGKVVDNREFQQAQQTLYRNQPNEFSAKKDLWDYFLQKSLLQDEAKQLGLGVGELEMESMLYGPEYSPFIRRQFSNPSTGQLDVNQLNSIKAGIDAGDLPKEQEQQWNFLAKFAEEERVQAKVIGMMGKGLYTPSWLVEDNYMDENTTMTAEYVKIPYSEISASGISVTDNDIKAYINQHQAEYTRAEEERVAEYIVFEVSPTSADSAALRSELDTIKSRWSVTDNDSSFALINRGIFNQVYIKEDQLDPEISAALTTADAGTTFGPYYKNGYYKLTKLIDKKVLADSVRYRHILLSVNPNDANSIAAADARADSLIGVLEAGAERFDTLAARFSGDQTASTGGDMGYVASVPWSPDINNLILYRAERGKYYKSFSRFGIHVVEVTGEKMGARDMGYKIASIARIIIPSQNTQEAVFRKANDFLFDNRDIEKMRASAKELGMTVSTSKPKGINDYTFGPLGESQTSRKLVKDLFDEDLKVGEVNAEIGDYSDPTNYYRKYCIVSALKEIRSPGLASVENVRSEVEPILLNRAKAESAKAEIAAMGLEAAANKYGSTVLTQDNISFGSSIIPVIGEEPAVAAALSQLNNGETTVVGGNNAIYYLKLNEKQAAVPATNIPQLRSTANQAAQSLIPNAVIQAMRDGAEVEDKRSVFF